VIEDVEAALEANTPALLKRAPDLFSIKELTEKPLPNIREASGHPAGKILERRTRRNRPQYGGLRCPVASGERQWIEILVSVMVRIPPLAHQFFRNHLQLSSHSAWNLVHFFSTSEISGGKHFCYSGLTNSFGSKRFWRAAFWRCWPRISIQPSFACAMTCNRNNPLVQCSQVRPSAMLARPLRNGREPRTMEQIPSLHHTICGKRLPKPVRW